MKKTPTSIKCVYSLEKINLTYCLGLTRAPSIQKFWYQKGNKMSSKSPIRTTNTTDKNILRSSNSINKSLREIRKSCYDIKRNLSPSSENFKCNPSLKNIKLKQDLQNKFKASKQ